MMCPTLSRALALWWRRSVGSTPAWIGSSIVLTCWSDGRIPSRRFTRAGWPDLIRPFTSLFLFRRLLLFTCRGLIDHFHTATIASHLPPHHSPSFGGS